MEVKFMPLGNGVERIVVTKSCNEQFIPQHVLKQIVDDAICQRQNEERRVRFDNSNYRMQPNREPDGIDVHVDRPLRENFPNYRSWERAISNYRNLEYAAKRCDWPCREPMRGQEKPMEFEDSFTQMFLREVFGF